MPVSEDITALLKLKFAAEGLDKLKESNVAIAGLTGAATAAGGAMFEAGKKAEGFQESMRPIQALGLETAKVMDRLRAGVLKVSDDTGIAAESLGKSLVGVEQAGYRGADALKVLRLEAEQSKATHESLSGIVENESRLFRAWGAQGAAVAKDADVMTASMASGARSVEDFSTSMAKLAPSAKAAGISFSESAAAVTTLTQEGQKSRPVVSGLSTIFADLTENTAQHAKAAAAVGTTWASIRAAGGGTMIGTLQAIDEAVQHTSHSHEEYMGHLRTLLGSQQAVNTFLSLQAQGWKGLREHLQGTANSAGATQRAFDKSMEGIGNQFGKLKNTIENIGIRLMTPILGPAEKFLQWTNTNLPKGITIAEGALGRLGKATEPLRAAIGDHLLIAFESIRSMLAAKLPAGIALAESALTGLRNLILGHTDAVQKHVPWLQSMNREFLNHGEIVDAARPPLERHKGLLQEMIGPMQKLADSTQKFGEHTATAFKDAPTWRDTLDKMGDAGNHAASAVEHITHALELFFPKADTAKNKSDTLSHSFGSDLAGAINLAAGMIDQVAGALDYLSKSVDGSISQIMALKRQADAISAFFNHMADSLQQWEMQQLDKFTSWLGEQFGKLTKLAGDWFGSIGSKITGWMSNVFNTITKPFRDAFDAILGHSIVPDLVNGVVAWFAKLPGMIVGALAGLVKDVLGVFGDLTGGLAGWMKDRLTDFGTWAGKIPGDIGTGITSNAGKIKDALLNAVKAALSTALDWVKSHNPFDWLKDHMPSLSLPGVGGGDVAQPSTAGAYFGFRSTGFVNSGVESGNLAMLQAMGVPYSGAVQDWDYAGSPQAVRLPGGAGVSYRFMGSSTIDDARGHMGTYLDFMAPGGGVIGLNHLSGTPGFRQGQMVAGGTVIGTSGYSSGQFGSGYHLCLVTDSKGREFLAALTDQQFQGALAAGKGLDVGALPSAVRRYGPQIQQAASMAHVPASLVAAVMEAESSGNPRSLSATGAIGLMQLEPYNTTVKRMGLSAAQLWNPAVNIQAGANEIARLLRGAAHGNVATALGMYNAGEGGNLQARDVQAYVNRVLGFYGQYRPSGGGGAPMGPGGIDWPTYLRAQHYVPPPPPGGYFNVSNPAMQALAATSAGAPAYSTFAQAQAGFNALPAQIQKAMDGLKSLPPDVAKHIKDELASSAQKWEAAGAKFNAGWRQEMQTDRAARDQRNATYQAARNTANETYNKKLADILGSHPKAFAAETTRLTKAQESENRRHETALSRAEMQGPAAVAAENARHAAKEVEIGVTHEKNLERITGQHAQQVHDAIKKAGETRQTAIDRAWTAHQKSYESEHRQHEKNLTTIHNGLVSGMNKSAADYKKAASDLAKATQDTAAILQARQKGAQRQIGEATSGLTLAYAGDPAAQSVKYYAQELANATAAMVKWTVATAQGTLTAGLVTRSFATISQGLTDAGKAVQDRIDQFLLAGKDAPARLQKMLAGVADAEAMVKRLQDAGALLTSVAEGDLAKTVSGVQTLATDITGQWSQVFTRTGNAQNQYADAVVQWTGIVHEAARAQADQQIALGRLTGDAGQVDAGLKTLYDQVTTTIGDERLGITGAGVSLTALVDKADGLASNFTSLSGIVSGFQSTLSAVRETIDTAFARTGQIGTEGLNAYRDAQGHVTQATWDQVAGNLALARQTGDMQGALSALGEEIKLQTDRVAYLGATQGQASQTYRDALSQLTGLKEELKQLQTGYDQLIGTTGATSTQMDNLTSQIDKAKIAVADAAKQYGAGSTQYKNAQDALVKLQGEYDTAAKDWQKTTSDGIAAWKGFFDATDTASTLAKEMFKPIKTAAEDTSSDIKDLGTKSQDAATTIVQSATDLAKAVQKVIADLGSLSKIQSTGSVSVSGSPIYVGGAQVPGTSAAGTTGATVAASMPPYGYKGVNQYAEAPGDTVALITSLGARPGSPAAAALAQSLGIGPRSTAPGAAAQIAFADMATGTGTTGVASAPAGLANTPAGWLAYAGVTQPDWSQVSSGSDVAYPIQGQAATADPFRPGFDIYGNPLYGTAAYDSGAQASYQRVAGMLSSGGGAADTTGGGGISGSIRKIGGVSSLGTPENPISVTSPALTQAATATQQMVQALQDANAKLQQQLVAQQAELDFVKSQLRTEESGLLAAQATTGTETGLANELGNLAGFRLANP